MHFALAIFIEWAKNVTRLLAIIRCWLYTTFLWWLVVDDDGDDSLFWSHNAAHSLHRFEQRWIKIWSEWVSVASTWPISQAPTVCRVCAVQCACFGSICVGNLIASFVFTSNDVVCHSLIKNANDIPHFIENCIRCAGRQLYDFVGAVLCNLTTSPSRPGYIAIPIEDARALAPHIFLFFNCRVSCRCWHRNWMLSEFEKWSSSTHSCERAKWQGDWWLWIIKKNNQWKMFDRFITTGCVQPKLGFCFDLNSVVRFIRLHTECSPARPARFVEEVKIVIHS